MVSAPGPVVNEFRGDIYVAIGVIWQPTWRSVPAKRPECSMNTDGILRKSLFLTAILLVSSWLASCSQGTSKSNGHRDRRASE